jgi:hypothetical protein
MFDVGRKILLPELPVTVCCPVGARCFCPRALLESKYRHAPALSPTSCTLDNTRHETGLPFSHYAAYRSLHVLLNLERSRPITVSHLRLTFLFGLCTTFGEAAKLRLLVRVRRIDSDSLRALVS